MTEFELNVDASSGISPDEQREIIANIDAIAGTGLHADAPKKVTARKRGVLFPLVVNIAALLLLGGGLFALWNVFRLDNSVIRMSGGELDSAEGRLIEEIRDEFDAARAEIARLGRDAEKAAAFERQISGFYASVNEAFLKGDLYAAQTRLRSMREFIDTPSFAGIRQIEERRSLNLATLDVMSRLVDESIRNSRVTEELNAAAALAETAEREKTAALRLVEERESELAGLKKTAQDRAGQLAERDRTIGELRAQGAELRQTISANEQRITSLSSQNNVLTQRLSAVQQALSPAAAAEN